MPPDRRQGHVLPGDEDTISTKALHAASAIVATALLVGGLAGPADASIIAGGSSNKIAADALGAVVEFELARTPGDRYHGWDHGVDRGSGGSGPDSNRLAIGPGATRLELSHPLDGTASAITCDFDSDSGSFSASFTGEEWYGSEPVSMDIPARTVASDSATVRVQCGGDNDAYVNWFLDEDSGAPSVVSLADDHTTLVNVNLADSYFSPGETRTLSPGDRVIVRGQPGDLPVASGSPATEFFVEAVLPDANASFSLENITISDDGSSVSATVPVEIPDQFFDGFRTELNLRSRVERPRTDTTPLFRQNIAWVAPITLSRATPPPTVVESSTRLTMVRPVTLSKIRSKVAIRVSADGAIPTGVVIVTVGNREVRAKLRADGTAIILLPTLPKGSYDVSARYEGSTTVAPSASETSQLRVVL